MHEKSLYEAHLHHTGSKELCYFHGALGFRSSQATLTSLLFWRPYPHVLFAQSAIPQPAISATSPDASRTTVQPVSTAISRYEMVVSRIARSVPFGIDFCGSWTTKILLPPNIIQTFFFHRGIQSKVRYKLVTNTFCISKRKYYKNRATTLIPKRGRDILQDLLALLTSLKMSKDVGAIVRSTSKHFVGI